MVFICDLQFKEFWNVPMYHLKDKLVVGLGWNNVAFVAFNKISAIPRFLQWRKRDTQERDLPHGRGSERKIWQWGRIHCGHTLLHCSTHTPELAASHCRKEKNTRVLPTLQVLGDLSSWIEPSPSSMPLSDFKLSSITSISFSGAQSKDWEDVLTACSSLSVQDLSQLNILWSWRWTIDSAWPITGKVMLSP